MVTHWEWPCGFSVFPTNASTRKIVAGATQLRRHVQDSVMLKQDVLVRARKRKCVAQLLHAPVAGRRKCDVEVEDAPLAMLDDEKAVERAKR